MGSVVFIYLALVYKFTKHFTAIKEFLTCTWLFLHHLDVLEPIIAQRAAGLFWAGMQPSPLVVDSFFEIVQSQVVSSRFL